MSVFLLNSESEVVVDSPGGTTDQGPVYGDAHQALTDFWPKTTEEIKRIQHLDVRCQSLPLARIKKIMKLDEDVKMISAEAPVLFAKAAELFIQEITLRSWVHTEDNKRRTLQRNDIAMAISKYDQFDFLIDIVPREEAARATRSQLPVDQVFYLQVGEGGGGEASTGGGGGSAGEEEEQDDPEVGILHQGGVPLQLPPQPATQDKPAVPGNIQVLQQVVGPSGEFTHIPMQISDRQMEMIRLQVESGGSPIVIQPQVVQVRQPNQPLFIQALSGPQD